MYRKIVAVCSCYCAVSLAYAESNDVNPTPALIPISTVEVQVQRALKSPSGAYLLQLGSGYWNPKAILYDQAQNQMIPLTGQQKGHSIRLWADPQSGLVQQAIQLSGDLNVETGIYRATLTNQLDGFQQPLVFSPLVTVAQRPTFLFKFYGRENNVTAEQNIEKIEVIDRKSKKIYQQLGGFSALATAVQYVDLNFDGYFDLVLTASSQQKNAALSSIYWLYNPKTKQFQRSPQLERLGGSPSIDIATQQIRFADRLYQVKDGQFYPIK
ncbi:MULTISPECIES: XAC2610-related protein [unclassified Acinetobacter]|uniref:XAC2610-related protein n=1 Tax=unclassified Acinetobacter TaxID=196816 RepID=UPI002934EEE5|nr:MULTISPECIES: hypothetical protein [unclassified Acinetobacter]WOE30433.1 hypothetical protein QSG84_08400 [Acinetobacter sp. SAAs470]WOE38624.1 hypothetical protein QSG86_02065 [Acinetobacter sp. SAAs474]